MRTLLCLSALLVLSSCGDEEEGLTAMEACSQVQGAFCDKVFNCLPAAEKEARKAAIGLNAADCKVKFVASECNADKIRCDVGKTYKPANAKACVTGVTALSCNDITGGNLVTPAICDQVCQ
jgi:hypothetical protein